MVLTPVPVIWIGKVEYVPFRIDVAESNARTIHPEIQMARLSCTTKQGLDEWLH